MRIETKHPRLGYALFALLAIWGLLLLFIPPNEARQWWVSATALSAGWVFIGIVSGFTSWARTAVPSAVTGLFAVFYTADHGFSAPAWMFILLALAAGTVHIAACRRRSAAS